MNVLIAGGSGLIGRALVKQLVSNGYGVAVLSRSSMVNGLGDGVETVRWDGCTSHGWEDAARRADVIINLAGENIGAVPWSRARKEKIRLSRLQAGRAIVSAVQAGARPKVLIQSSAVGYYGAIHGRELGEESPAGNDFLAKVCLDWEESTRAVEELDVRRVVVRTGVVLDAHAGALERMLMPFRLFAGGPLGSGKQGVSWIHLADEVGAIQYLMEKEDARGIYNLTAPNPVTNAVLGRALGRVLHRPYWLPVPGFALRMLLGEMSTLVLDGQWVLPMRLLEMGYPFQFTEIEAALRDLL